MEPDRDRTTPPGGASASASGGAAFPGRQVLFYDPDGPLGGTFTCPVCRAQAWQPDLIPHAPTCVQRPPESPAAARGAAR